MPDFRFFATREESSSFLRDLLAGGDWRVVPGEQESPAPKQYTKLTPKLEEDIRQNPKLHLHGPFSTHPPFVTQLRDGGYILGDAGGGPHIVHMMPSVREGILLEGALWTQPKYQLTDTQFTGPTPALKAAYADMVKRLKQHLVRWEGLWISPGALQLLKDGQAELPGDLKPLGVLARKAKELPQLKPVVPSTSKKTTKRKVAARTATP